MALSLLQNERIHAASFRPTGEISYAQGEICVLAPCPSIIPNVGEESQDATVLTLRPLTILFLRQLGDAGAWERASKSNLASPRSLDGAQRNPGNVGLPNPCPWIPQAARAKAAALPVLSFRTHVRNLETSPCSYSDCFHGNDSARNNQNQPINLIQPAQSKSKERQGHHPRSPFILSALFRQQHFKADDQNDALQSHQAQTLVVVT